jgi:hypothetical protein
MEVLGVVLAAMATVIIVYLAVYTLPTSLMKFIRARRQERSQGETSEGPDSEHTYEIYVSLHAA